jgi:P27 family predicted phage terminase small subunit
VATATRIPIPPKWLPTRAKKIFKQICGFLIQNDAVCVIDALYVSMAAACMDRYIDAEISVALNGTTQSYESGATAVSAEYTVMNNERKMFDQYARRLGLNIASREKLVTMQSENVQEDDFFAQLTKSRAYNN